jgi:hypothetical protein
MKHTLKGVLQRTEQGGFEVYLDGEYLSPKHSQGIFNHSPDGFAWGYNGSGPSQLALAVLLKNCDKGIAVAQYKQFREAVIAKLDRNSGFEIEIEWPIPESEQEHEEDHVTIKDVHPDHPDNK